MEWESHCGTMGGKSVSRMKSLLFFIAGGAVVFSGEEGPHAKRPNRNPGSSTRPGGSLAKTSGVPVIWDTNRNNHIMLEIFDKCRNPICVRDLRVCFLLSGALDIVLVVAFVTIPGHRSGCGIRYYFWDRSCEHILIALANTYWSHPVQGFQCTSMSVEIKKYFRTGKILDKVLTIPGSEYVPRHIW